MENIAGYFHVLLVFTSVLFAFYQYHENRQTKIIEEEQKELRSKKFDLADKNEGLQDVKKMWEDILLIKPITNYPTFFALLVLLMLYVTFFALGMSAGWCPANYAIYAIAVVSHAIKVFSIFLVILSIVIFFRWQKMNSQLKKFRDTVKNFNLLYDTVSKAISSKVKENTKEE